MSAGDASGDSTSLTQSGLRASWRAVAASVTGRSHQRQKQGCQDCSLFRTAPDGSLVAAVADGASSATLGRLGAELAALTAVEAIVSGTQVSHWPTDRESWATGLKAALQAAHRAVTDAAAERDVDPQQLATTLIVAVATPDAVAAAQVGDGAVVVRDAGNRIASLTTPWQEEYLNATSFITSAEAVEQPQVVVWPGRATQLAAFSDGLQMLALSMPDGNPHAPFFTPLFGFVAACENDHDAQAQLREFLGSPKITGRTDDDITLLLASRLD